MLWNGSRLVCVMSIYSFQRVRGLISSLCYFVVVLTFCFSSSAYEGATLYAGFVSGCSTLSSHQGVF